MAGVALSLDDVRAAAERLSGIAHRTPVLTSRTLDERTGSTAFLKAECLQRGGAFKFRGAYNMVSSLGPEERERGVVAYSSGQPRAGRGARGAAARPSATIVMPADRRQRSSTRPAATAPSGHLRPLHRGSRRARRRAAAERGGLTLVPPYEHPLVMAGQGTAALELLEDVPDLDALLVPVGGGGLIAGCATAAKALRPGIRIIGVEPEAGDDTRRRSRRASASASPCPAPSPTARGRLPRRAHLRPQPSSSSMTIVQVRRRDPRRDGFLFDRMKLVAEPSGASAAAALLAGRAEAGGARIGVDHLRRERGRRPVRRA